MPFKIEHFRENVDRLITGAAREGLLQACDAYRDLTPLRQKAAAMHALMELLDQTATVGDREELMQSCGRRCIGASILSKATALRNRATDLDELVALLNEAHIGGGHLACEGETVLAEYNRCYCGAVSQTRTTFSPTYCQCSCGWLRQLFETILNRPVRVELLSSIIQGDRQCRFRIHLR